jgi:hypothetical protein
MNCRKDWLVNYSKDWLVKYRKDWLMNYSKDWLMKYRKLVDELSSLPGELGPGYICSPGPGAITTFLITSFLNTK